MKLLECFDMHGCDKGSRRHRYDMAYEPVFESIREEPVRLLEIGILAGASLKSWLDYFPNAEIIGVDTFQRISPENVPVLKSRRVSWWKCDSTLFVPDMERVDIIIDDGSHKAAAQVATFNQYWPLLKDGGMYFIEDITAPSEIAMTLGHHRIGFCKGAAGEYLARIIA